MYTARVRGQKRYTPTEFRGADALGHAAVRRSKGYRLHKESSAKTESHPALRYCPVSFNCTGSAGDGPHSSSSIDSTGRKGASECCHTALRPGGDARSLSSQAGEPTPRGNHRGNVPHL